MRSTTDALRLGLSHHQAGDLAQAEQCYRQVLHAEPENADALALLGALDLSRGKLTEAMSSLRGAIRINPSHAAAHDNLGVVLAGQGRLQEALDSFEQALRLRPSHAETHLNLGNALSKLGRLDAAIRSYRQAAGCGSKNAVVHFRLGALFTQLRQFQDARGSYEQALRLNPDHAEAHTNLGNVLLELVRVDEAVVHAREAVRLRPGFAEAHLNLGFALMRQGKMEDATESLRRAVQLKPGMAAAHYNLGVALSQQSNFDEAIVGYEESLGLRPDDPETHFGLGIALLRLGRPDEALARFNAALRLRPDYPEARHNRSAVWLLKGDFERGWPEYEWRWQCKEFGKRSFEQPTWDGSPLQGRTILLHAEQGLGDTLQFVRYTSLVKDRGGTVWLQCPAALHALLSRCRGIDRFFAADEALPAFDVHAPLLSLPGIFKTSLATIPAPIPYISADPELVERWSGESGSQTGFKIGICWQGNPKYRFDAARSVPLAEFEPLARVDSVVLISLQKGPGTEQIRERAGRFPVADLGSTLDETAGAFMDTAAVMKNLDLVITGDTAIAHLAGALGVRVWLAVPFMPDWRWLLDREDSPWYPTMRLFRQPAIGEWESVFARMADEVQKELRNERRGEPIAVEISAGELIDKITILEIKRDHIRDAAKLQNVQTELSALIAARERAIPESAELAQLTAQLKAVNAALWDVEDAIRLCERDGDFGSRFVELARSVYLTNDRRSALKRRINELLGSRLKEEKAYATYGQPGSAAP